MASTNLAFAGVAAQAQAIRGGAVSSVELTTACLARIAQLDPQINAFRVVMTEAALAEAARCDELRAAGTDLPLLGVPIAIKDEMDVAGEVTTYGGSANVTPAAADSEVVHKLRLAGAVIIGKTNMPEFGQWPFTESSTFGYTRNPWNLQHITGGSSGGSAAAVAAGMVGAALGGDGGGSIRIPSACCGLFGLKTQRGRVSTAPLPDLWHTLGVYGPIARSVLDAAVFGDAIRGNQPSDNYKAAEPRMSFVEAAQTPPGKLRIAVSDKPSVLGVKLDPQQRSALDSTAELLASLGHDVTREDPDYGLPMIPFAPQNAFGLRDEAALVERPDLLERRTKQNLATGKLIPRATLARGIAQGEKLSGRINRIFERYDLVLTPTIAHVPRKVGVLDGATAIEATLRALPYIAYAMVWNVAGNPCASVPAGFSSEGLPLAVQLIGPPGDEPTILQAAAQLEAARPWADALPAVS